jgi:GH24 family phage-related lysozyme (muramidase)
MVFSAELLSAVREHEGAVEHFYLDTTGNVTIGLGFLVANLEAALALPLVDRQSGAAASREAVERSFRAVAAAPMGQRAAAYAALCSVKLPAQAQEQLLGHKLEEFRVGLTRHFENFSQLPAPVTHALLDMAFNLGLNGLLQKFPKFCAAIRSGDFAAAARESRRPQVGEQRNQRVREWLERAAGQKPAVAGSGGDSARGAAAPGRSAPGSTSPEGGATGGGPAGGGSAPKPPRDGRVR